jgi:hypothetical protein
MKTFITALLGDQSAPLFFSNFFFALIGVALMLLIHSTERNLDSNRTPTEFSWSFFLSDNWKRLVAGLIMIFVSLRFAPELFGVEISPFWAFAIGMLNDKLAQVIKDKTNILGQKK